jgi:hypothetical protein
MNASRLTASHAQALPRPFTKLRELDFDKAAADVLAALP